MQGDQPFCTKKREKHVIDGRGVREKTLKDGVLSPVKLKSDLFLTGVSGVKQKTSRSTKKKVSFSFGKGKVAGGERGKLIYARQARERIGRAKDRVVVLSPFQGNVRYATEGEVQADRCKRKKRMRKTKSLGEVTVKLQSENAMGPGWDGKSIGYGLSRRPRLPKLQATRIGEKHKHERGGIRDICKLRWTLGAENQTPRTSVKEKSQGG